MKKKPFKITKLGVYRTRTGWSVNVTTFDRRSKRWPWYGVVANGISRNWRANGSWCRKAGELSQFDIVAYVGPLPAPKDPNDVMDANGISGLMLDKMQAVIAEGLTTGSTDIRELLYCAYREAQKIQKTYQTNTPSKR